CLGGAASGADGTDGMLLVEPRCVECEGDEHCAWPYVSEDESGVCLGHECVPCELGANRGCPVDAPYCVDVHAVTAVTAGDAAVGHSGDLVEGKVSGAGECVECLSETDCEAVRPACVEHACVECDRDAHCTSAEASRCDVSTNTCVACNAEGGCAHLEGTPACDISAGRCVECTRADQTACDDGQRGFDYACVTLEGDPAYQTCSDKVRGESGQCTECVSDAQCRAGFRCVPETFRRPDGGSEQPTGRYYCMALESELGGGNECGDNRPFIGFMEATSEGGAQGTYCRPRYATCASYRAHGAGPDTVPDGQPGAGNETCLSDDSCGLPNLRDGYCVNFTPTANRCTYECASDSDCKSGQTCTFDGAPAGIPAGNGVCSLN